MELIRELWELYKINYGTIFIITWIVWAIGGIAITLLENANLLTLKKTEDPTEYAFMGIFGGAVAGFLNFMCIPLTFWFVFHLLILNKKRIHNLIDTTGLIYWIPVLTLLTVFLL